MSVGAVRRPSWERDPLWVEPKVDAPDLCEAELVEAILEAQLLQGREYARDLEAVARLACRRPADRPLASATGQGGPELDASTLSDRVLAGVREDFVAELAVTRGCSEHQARVVLREALLLTGPLAPAWSHLFAGVLTVPHAKAVVDLLGDATPEVADEVLARVLPRAEGLTASEFRERLRYRLYRVDAEAKERRRREALTTQGMWVRRVDEGISELITRGPTPEIHAQYDAY